MHHLSRGAELTRLPAAMKDLSITGGKHGAPHRNAAETPAFFQAVNFLLACFFRCLWQYLKRGEEQHSQFRGILYRQPEQWAPG